MSISMYQASIPVFVRGLKNLSTILEKAAAHAEAKKIDPTVFLTARLAPDMFALMRQVQIVSDTAKGAAARLAGTEIPSFPDNETTFADLQQRIRKTIDFVQGFTPDQIDGSEERPVTVKLRSGDQHFNGQTYLLGFALPNLFFHITTAYDILRHNGVELGKKDYLGAN